MVSPSFDNCVLMFCCALSGLLAVSFGYLNECVAVIPSVVCIERQKPSPVSEIAIATGRLRIGLYRLSLSRNEMSALRKTGIPDWILPVLISAWYVSQ